METMVVSAVSCRHLRSASECGKDLQFDAEASVVAHDETRCHQVVGELSYLHTVPKDAAETGGGASCAH